MPDSLSKISQTTLDAFLYASSACGAGISVVLGLLLRHEKSISSVKKDVKDIKDTPIVTMSMCNDRTGSLEDKVEELHKDVRLILEKMIPEQK